MKALQRFLYYGFWWSVLISMVVGVMGICFLSKPVIGEVIHKFCQLGSLMSDNPIGYVLVGIGVLISLPK